MPEETDPLQLARDIAAGFRRSDGEAPNPRRRARPTDGRKDREDAVPLSQVIDELVAAQGWTAPLAAQRIYTDWADIVGPEVAQHATVEGFADQVVSVRTSSTAWATQLRLLAPRIVARLNDELGDGSVLRIDVRGPAAPSWRHGKRTVKGRGPRDTYG